MDIFTSNWGVPHKHSPESQEMLHLKLRGDGIGPPLSPVRTGALMRIVFIVGEIVYDSCKINGLSLAVNERLGLSSAADCSSRVFGGCGRVDHFERPEYEVHSIL